MSNLQEKTLAKYKSIYPNHTLKEISKVTNIQVTRVFRIFNGSEMKLKELESFQNAIKSIKPNSEKRMIDLIKECSQKLSKAKLNNLLCDLETLLKMESCKVNLNSYSQDAIC